MQYMYLFLGSRSRLSITLCTKTSVCCESLRDCDGRDGVIGRDGVPGPPGSPRWGKIEHGTEGPQGATGPCNRGSPRWGTCKIEHDTEGPQGATGPMGPERLTVRNGSVGHPGKKRSIGYHGHPGVKGLPGLWGDPGHDDKGNTGAQGPVG